MRRPDKRALTHAAGIAVAVLASGYLMWSVAAQADRVDTLSQALADEQQAAKDRGETPVAPAPSDLLDDPGQYQGPKGDPGPPGDNGRGVNNVQCLDGTWIVTYTDGTVDDDAGDCTGPKGADGEGGQAGEPGPSGPAGPSGSDGDDGRGIASAECDPATGHWVITYSDGEMDSDAGPCTLLNP